jgi:NAD(P)H-hydrate epimerase
VKVVTAEQMRLIDKTSIEDYLIPGYILMNNAGKSIADFIADKIKVKKIAVFCGKGNNGGDGFAAAFYLHNSGFNVELYLAGYKKDVSPASDLFLRICDKSGIPIHEIRDEDNPEFTPDENTAIIDAVTGTGFSGTPSGTVHKFINIINSSGCTVFAADIPSGLPADGGEPCGPAVYADYTITMGLPKISLVTWPGAEYCGNVYAADIGFPPEFTESSTLKVSLTDEVIVMNLPCTLEAESYKGKRGHTLIIGGFSGMEGAALLTASALFKTGTGLATLLTDCEARKITAGKIPELMTISFPDIPEKSRIVELIDNEKYSSLIIGPGMGRTGYASMIFTIVIDNLPLTKIKKVLIDGDGLYHLSIYLKEKKLPENIQFIITPHFMEASRISGKAVEEIMASRLESCGEIAAYSKTVCLLKGPGSIISDGEYSVINTTGNPALATAGSGDVLSGIIGSFMNMDIPLIQAGAAGMYIHGLCADIYLSENPQYTMKAGDIIDRIREALKIALY